jgi:ABC-type uncharacterized transport system substrate-binding protein
MKRREFITLLGGAAVVWPLAARAQQPAMPVVGFLNGTSPEGYGRFLSSFRQGLSETGYVEGRNVLFEYRWAEGHYDRLPALVADLISRRVTVIAATSTPANLIAKTATTTIPIVFTTSSDPVDLGLVTSLSRPGGNVTGVVTLNVELASKRLEQLHELVPSASVIALLLNPTNPNVKNELNDLQGAARTIGHQLLVVEARTEDEIDMAFASFVQQQARALLVTGCFFLRPAQSTHHSGETLCSSRDLRSAGVRRAGWSDELWRQRYRCVSSGRNLHGPDHQG